MNEKKKEQKSILKKIKIMFPPLTIVGIVAGAIGGYFYYLKVGCISGTCAITSNPWVSTLWGALIGYLVFDIFNRKPKAKKKS